MSDVPFHMTRMGMRFYEYTAPALVRELQRLNENLERLINLQQPQPKKEDQDEDRTEEGTHPPHGG